MQDRRPFGDNADLNPEARTVDHIAEIRQAAEHARLKAAADFARLADSLARGERPPAEALDILTRAGRTPENLEQAVRVARERLHLEPLAGRFAEIVAERGTVEAELRAADERASAELAEFQRKLAERLNPLRQRVAELAEAEQESRAAKQRLQHLSQRPDMARRLPAVAEIEEE